MISACTHMPHVNAAGEAFAHDLGIVAVGDDPELGREVLDQHRHHVRQQHDPQQQVAELRAAFDVGGEVARIDVGDRGDERRAEHRDRRAHATLGQQLLERARARERPAELPGQRYRGALCGTLERGDRLDGQRRHPRASCTSTRMASREPAADRVLALAEAHEQRAAERLALEDLEALSRRDPVARRGSAASPGRSRRRARTLPRHRPAALEAVRRALFDLKLGAGDRVAVRVDRGVSELGRDQLLEILGEHVLEDLGLGVNPIPRHPQRIGQEALDQPVVADHLQRHAPPIGGEAHSPVRGMSREPQLVELLEHRRDRARRDAQALGQSVGGHGLRRCATPARRSPSSSPRSPMTATTP